jgi:hypothetical protein
MQRKSNRLAKSPLAALRLPPAKQLPPKNQQPSVALKSQVD